MKKDGFEDDIEVLCVNVQKDHKYIVAIIASGFSVATVMQYMKLSTVRLMNEKPSFIIKAMYGIGSS
ncbi:MAG: hypothetical protein KA120_05210 [Candidatus Goldbacteria bacterium]|nr:hypothetical protein [Candidatus Goldiibacteriota bacterium]